MDATPLDKLKTTTLGDLTQTQIHDTAASTFVSRPGATKIAREIHRAKLAIATFGGGGIIPSKGDVQPTTITDIPLPAASTMIPAIGEVWRFDFGMLTVANGASSTNTILLQVEDSDGNPTYEISGTVPANEVGQPFNAMPFWLTAPLFIRITSNKSDTSLVTLAVQYEAM
ncbi:MAG: hypothetical protein CXX80_03390 [Methanobacteriota archaeon]|nr:MAG: hypothetical protein CXX80_12650 [Euryarchaeota archaeon]PXY72580.1 MAG: hypothetical protein CXX80_09510 [Euryarchaeota archaeon]PXY76160.1 MAG: hypothetical protein CXX80_03390 [Euryarchaeota archaeon]